MEIPDYTLVVGVDRKHLEQLALVWPTWKRHKPSLLARRMVLFFDWTQVTAADVWGAIDHPNMFLKRWPPLDFDTSAYGEDTGSKWTNPQRYKMLSGFVHVPRAWVSTPYWLKIDTDVIATGQDDWIDPGWFKGDPAIVSQRWGYTKPPDQMLRLDHWARDHRSDLPMLEGTKPLDLTPASSSSRVSHKRIISFVGFFNTEFTKQCAKMAEDTCGRCRLPVPSQDGFQFYVAKRLGLGIVRTNVKSKGWKQRNTMKSIRVAVEEAMGND